MYRGRREREREIYPPAILNVEVKEAASKLVLHRTQICCKGWRVLLETSLCACICSDLVGIIDSSSDLAGIMDSSMSVKAKGVQIV